MDESGVNRFLASRYNLRRCRSGPHHPSFLGNPRGPDLEPDRSGLQWCSFKIHENGNLTSPPQWESFADVWVDLLAVDPEAPERIHQAVARTKENPRRQECFLIPSADAPLRMTDTRYQADPDARIEKKDLVWAFVNRFHGKTLEGMCFLDKQNSGSGPRPKVYLSDFDYWLLTGGREITSRSLDLGNNLCHRGSDLELRGCCCYRFASSLIGDRARLPTVVGTNQ